MIVGHLNNGLCLIQKQTECEFYWWESIQSMSFDWNCRDLNFRKFVLQILGFDNCELVASIWWLRFTGFLGCWFSGSSSHWSSSYLVLCEPIASTIIPNVPILIGISFNCVDTYDQVAVTIREFQFENGRMFVDEFREVFIQTANDWLGYNISESIEWNRQSRDGTMKNNEVNHLTFSNAYAFISASASKKASLL